MGALHPDLELAKRAAGGEEQAWRLILETSGRSLFALLCYQVSNREEALDLLQETYLQAFRNLGSYRGEGPLGAWLRSIALRKALDWKRTMLRRIKQTVGLTDSMAFTAAVEPDLDAERGREEIRRALTSLPAAQRAVFLLREWEGMSFREIGQILGAKEATARVHHTRARARLRRTLRRSRLILPDWGLEGQDS
jgi:RNA polymerase sigma-70 factor, ECF subfamily